MSKLAYGKIRETSTLKRDSEGKPFKIKRTHTTKNADGSKTKTVKMVWATDPLGHVVQKESVDAANAIFCTLCDVSVAQLWCTTKGRYGWCTRGVASGKNDTRQEAFAAMHAALSREECKCLCLKMPEDA